MAEAWLLRSFCRSSKSTSPRTARSCTSRAADSLNQARTLCRYSAVTSLSSMSRNPAVRRRLGCSCRVRTPGGPARTACRCCKDDRFGARWIVRNANLPPRQRRRRQALSTESLAGIQQSTSVCTMASKLAGRNGRCLAVETTADDEASPSLRIRSHARRIPCMGRSVTVTRHPVLAAR